MCTVRYVGLLLEDPLAVPWPVIEHLAVQLDIEEPSIVKRYTERRQTLYDHAWEIRDAYGYHHLYEDPEWARRFRTFLHGRAWTHAEGAVALCNQAVGWLRRHRVLLPGVSVLARQVSEARVTHLHVIVRLPPGSVEPDPLQPRRDAEGRQPHGPPVDGARRPAGGRNQSLYICPQQRRHGTRGRAA
jgi:hypothetical protein